MSITASWRAGREAVAQFELFCAQQGWVFVEVPQQSDFGKDGYVDLTTASGDVRGNCFAVQIKGGRSRWRTGGYKIDATRAQRSRWIGSTMPVIGIAFDPDTERLHWCDLSRVLREEGLDAELLARRSAHLNGEPELKRFQKYIGATTQSQFAVLDLVSSDLDRQMEAAFVCWFVGREDGRALLLLRRMLFSLHPAVQEFAVWRLGAAIPHPDMFHSNDSTPSQEARATLTAGLTWTTDEARKLLGFIDDEGGLDRGTIGQTVFHLLVEDPQHEQLLRDVAVQAARAGDDSAASWALVIVTYLAEEQGRQRLDELLAAAPELHRNWAARQLIEMLDEHGHISLF